MANIPRLKEGSSRGETSAGELLPGQRCPIQGMITDVFVRPGNRAFIRINNEITARILTNSIGRDLNILREYAFETAIFHCRVLRNRPTILVECESVVFSDHVAYHA